MFCGRVTVAGCVKFIPISCMGPKHATKDTYLIFQAVYAQENVQVVQIWIMRIKCLENLVNV